MATGYRAARRQISKEGAKLLDFAEANNWHAEVTPKHLKLSKPGSKPVFVAVSPSCYRAYDNALSDLRRAERQIAEDQSKTTQQTSPCKGKAANLKFT